MSTIRVTCLLCEHPVDVAVSDVVLHLEGTAADAVNRYGFACPGCNVYVVRRATDAIVTALLSTGVQVTTGSLPPWESGDRPGIVLVDAGSSHVERLARSQAPPITEADVLLFRKALEDDGIMAAWLSA